MLLIHLHTSSHTEYNFFTGSIKESFKGDLSDTVCMGPLREEPFDNIQNLRSGVLAHGD
jgi:hypothetical protein